MNGSSSRANDSTVNKSNSSSRANGRDAGRRIPRSRTAAGEERKDRMKPRLHANHHRSTVVRLAYLSTRAHTWPGSVRYNNCAAASAYYCMERFALTTSLTIRLLPRSSSSYHRTRRRQLNRICQGRKTPPGRTGMPRVPQSSVSANCTGRRELGRSRCRCPRPAK